MKHLTTYKLFSFIKHIALRKRSRKEAQDRDDEARRQHMLEERRAARRAKELEENNAAAAASGKPAVLSDPAPSAARESGKTASKRSDDYLVSAHGNEGKTDPLSHHSSDSSSVYSKGGSPMHNEIMENLKRKSAAVATTSQVDHSNPSKVNTNSTLKPSNPQAALDTSLSKSVDSGPQVELQSSVVDSRVEPNLHSSKENSIKPGGQKSTREVISNKGASVKSRTQGSVTNSTACVLS